MATATLDSTNAAGASLRASCACVATAAIAQLGERQTEDLKVPGSIPGLGILAHSNVTCCASAPAMNATNHARTAGHALATGPRFTCASAWSSGMILGFGPGGPRFNSRSSPCDNTGARTTPTTAWRKTRCPSGLREWTQAPLAQAAWVQIPQVSHVTPKCTSMALACGAKGFGQRPCAATTAVGTPSEWLHPPWGSNPRPQG